MLKIKVNLDKNSYQSLLDDMKYFNVVKKDGSVNKNKFINLLFQNFYLEFIQETEAIANHAIKLMKKYNINNDSFVEELALELYDYKHQSIDTYYNESLTFYLSEENEFIFETLNSSSSKIGASAYFRKLIYRYLEYPQYKREEIIYKHILDPIFKAIEDNQIVKIKLDNSYITIKPYKIGTSKEEIYSYLLGISNGIPSSLHILKIRAVIILNNKFEFSKEELSLLENVYRLGIQFPFKNICKAEIILDESGIKLYKSKYLHRPKPVKIEDNHYFFECSFDQLLSYFISFGGKIKVVAPQYLAKSIYKSYKSYIDYYEENNQY